VPLSGVAPLALIVITGKDLCPKALLAAPGASAAEIVIGSSAGGGIDEEVPLPFFSF
jgi:hypothetical protein